MWYSLVYGTLQLLRRPPVCLLQSYAIADVAFSQSGRLMAVAAADGHVGVWDTSRFTSSSLPALWHDVLPPSAARVTKVDVAPDDAAVAIATWDGAVTVYGARPPSDAPDAKPSTSAAATAAAAAGAGAGAAAGAGAGAAAGAAAASVPKDDAEPAAGEWQLLGVVPAKPPPARPSPAPVFASSARLLTSGGTYVAWAPVTRPHRHSHSRGLAVACGVAQDCTVYRVQWGADGGPLLAHPVASVPMSGAVSGLASTHPKLWPQPSWPSTAAPASFVACSSPRELLSCAWAAVLPPPASPRPVPDGSPTSTYACCGVGSPKATAVVNFPALRATAAASCDGDAVRLVTPCDGEVACLRLPVEPDASAVTVNTLQLCCSSTAPTCAVFLHAAVAPSIAPVVDGSVAVAVAATLRRIRVEPQRAVVCWYRPAPDGDDTARFLFTVHTVVLPPGTLLHDGDGDGSCWGSCSLRPADVSLDGVVSFTLTHAGASTGMQWRLNVPLGEWTFGST